MALWVLQFNIVAGQTLEDGPFTGAFPQRGGGDVPCDLYLLVEPALPGSEEYCNDVVNLVGESFHRYRVSVTGGLLRAIQAAHADLRGWNSRSLRDQWLAMGISALAVRGDEAYLAQVGPALAYVRCGGELRSFRPTIPEAQGPLGLSLQAYPHFVHVDLSVGDVVLLASSTLEKVAMSRPLEHLLAGPPDECMPAIYQAARSLPCFGALLVAVVDEQVTP